MIGPIVSSISSSVASGVVNNCKFRWIATLNGLSQYVSLPEIPIAINDIVTFKILPGTVNPAGGMAIIDSESGNPRAPVFALFNGSLTMESWVGTMTINGVPNTGQNVFDGAEKVVVVVASGVGAIGRVGRGNGGLGAYANFPIYNLKVNDGSVYNYPIDDGPNNDPVIRNVADPSGATDGTVVNGTVPMWSRTCL